MEHKKNTVFVIAPRGRNRLVSYDKLSEMLNAHDQSANALSSITKTTQGEICPNTNYHTHVPLGDQISNLSKERLIDWRGYTEENNAAKKTKDLKEIHRSQTSFVVAGHQGATGATVHRNDGALIRARTL